MLLFSTFLQEQQTTGTPGLIFPSRTGFALLPLPPQKTTMKKPISKGSTSLPERFPKESSPSSQLLQLLQKKAQTNFSDSSTQPQEHPSSTGLSFPPKVSYVSRVSGSRALSTAASQLPASGTVTHWNNFITSRGRPSVIICKAQCKRKTRGLLFKIY